MSRTQEDIQKQYNQLAIELGAEAYRAFVLQKETDDSEVRQNQMKDKMLHLAEEAARLKQKQGIDLPEVKDEQSQS